MTNLPKIQANSQLIQAVNARELHIFLQSRQQFTDWIKNRIEKYEFVENQDFICVSENYETQRIDGQRGVTIKNEYYISIDMAKELAMVENNEQGKTARRYFIDCERQLKQPKELTRLEILQIAMQAEQENIALRGQLQQAQPKINHYDKVVARNQTLLNATQVGQKIGLSAFKLNNFLEMLKVYNRAVKRSRVFAQWFVDNGFGMMKQTDNGFSQPLFTLKGEAWIIEKLTAEGVA